MSGIKSWDKRHKLELLTRTVYNVFVFKKFKCSIKISKDRYKMYCIELSPFDILAEEFHPPFGIGESLKEAFLSFRLSLRSKRKRFNKKY